MKKLLLLISLSGLPIFATAPQACAIITGGNAGGGGGVNPAYLADQTGQANEGCNVLITFEANGSIITTNPNGAVSYDNGLDDNMVGIINDTGKAIGSVALSSAAQDIFDFDGDGMCDPTWTFSASGLGGATGGCTGATASVNGYFYLPAGVTESAVSSSGGLIDNNGTVNFAGGIAANGGMADFSLEGPVDLSLTVSSVPEPCSIVLFGTILSAPGLSGRRRLKKA